MRTVYTCIPGSYRNFNPDWTRSKPITIVQLFTTGYLLRGGYYNLYMFRCSACNTQGYPILPANFNVVVDMFLQHWILMVVEVEEETNPEGFFQDVKHLAAYLYVDDGFLGPTRLSRLQRLFYVLMEIVDRVGMCTNVDDTVTEYRIVYETTVLYDYTRLS